jgi:glycosyltransferase involved in cell wall biosynthesis
MRVCYFGTYRAEYSRNQIMMGGLRRNGVQVIECHAELWTGIEDRVQAASGGWIKPRFWGRLFRACLELLRKYHAVGDYDVMVVGYPGQFDVYLARLLTWLRRKPLVWDVFMSIYLIALERSLNQRSKLTVWLIRQLERLACHLPNRLILDTAEYVEWFHQTHSISPKQFRLVPTGADDRIFRPVTRQDAGDGFFRVIYYGTFISNHGVEYIIEAARLLANDHAVHFELVGAGPDKTKALLLAQRYGLSNVTFTDWLDQAELVKRVAGADVCLGAFGTTLQSVMTIQNKIYEGLAMLRPVITGDSPTVRSTLKHGEHVYLCERANPQALAEAIGVLRQNRELCSTLSNNGYIHYKRHFTVEQIGVRFKQHLIEAVS